MRETVTLGGVVLYAQQVGEYDKRLVILTGERGKITVFAHGVRRPKSPMIAAANPFVFADFTLFEGRDAYTLASAEVIDYFSELSFRIPEAWYGMYFLELASYYGREGLEAKESVNLIYVALKALEKGKMPVPLIRAVYELRMLTVNGEFAPPSKTDIPDEGAYAAVLHSAGAPLSRLFSFDLAEESGAAFCSFTERIVRRIVDKTFKSLAVIEEMR